MQSLSEILPIREDEFEKIRNLIYETFGIYMNEAKKNLLVARLERHIKQIGFHTFQEYYQHVQNDHTGEELSTLVNLITTNVTSFFRESDHLDYLKETALPNVVNDLKKISSRDLRIWCAAASTGEEPYGILMMLMEYFKNEYSQWNAGLLGTDISSNALNIARTGVYSSDGVQKVPALMRKAYFDQCDQNAYQVKSFLQKEITFRRFNLITEQFPFKKPFQIIFCRNVMIYFDEFTKNNLVEKLYHLTTPGGYLFIGHAESIVRMSTKYEFVAPSTYRRPY